MVRTEKRKSQDKEGFPGNISIKSSRHEAEHLAEQRGCAHRTPNIAALMH